MLSLAMMFLISGILRDVSAVDPVPTYQHRDPSTGHFLTCNKCEPGTHMTAHCTATTPTKCESCRHDHYTELWNYLPRCLYCNICTQNQEVETECSPIKNRVCRCKEGYYAVDDFCVRHKVCGLGYGVQARGTPQTDTVCEKCSDGYFSNLPSALDSCVKHRECASLELVLFPGSAFEDTVCGSCEDLANEGETLRAFLSAFLGTHMKRDGQLNKFVTRIIRKSVEKSCEDDTLLGQGDLRDQISAWLARAPMKQLQHLPKKLKDAQLISVAEKLTKTLEEIKRHSPGCSLRM